jgi:DNA-binding ferritin-like protein
MDNNQKMLSGCLTDMLFYVSQLHYAHWITKKNHHHVIIGETYEELAEELDELVESFIAASRPLSPVEAMMCDVHCKRPHKYAMLTDQKSILAFLEEILMRLRKGKRIVKDNEKYSFMTDTIMDMEQIVLGAIYQIEQE